MAYSAPYALDSARTCCSMSIAIHRASSPRAPRSTSAPSSAPACCCCPPLAAQAAGPASVLAWAGLLAVSLAIAVTFAALGVRHPVAGGAAAYVRAAFGRRAGGGHRLVVLRRRGGRRAGGVAHRRLLRRRTSPGGGPRGGGGGGRGDDGRRGGGQRRAACARRRACSWASPRCSPCCCSSPSPSALPSARAANWTPFAPHGWLAIGTAANLLMLSFVGWEAVAHLAGDFADPRRQLPRAMLAALRRSSPCSTSASR